MSQQEYEIIVNPVAGSGAGARALPRIERLLADHGLHFNLVITNSPGHAVALAREASLRGKIVVAAGGDGTANEVINGLMEAKPLGGALPALGVLGVGRGSDFAHGVGVPQDLAEACRVLAEGYRRPIDLGRVVGGLYPQGRYFGNCVGVGFDAIGTIEVAKLPRLGGFLSFFVAVLKTMFLYYRAPLTTVVYDGQTLTQPSLMISVMNGRRLGGGFWMAPDARLDDGLFDLCIAREMSRARMFRLIPHFLRGTQATQETITTGQAARVSITAVEGSLPAHADGEILCVDGDRLEIELLPRQIEVICQRPGSDR
jgi:diacylglycerol kinase (ATP)